MTNEPRTPRPIIDQEAVLNHLLAARQYRTLTTLWTAVGDVPVLLAEVDRLARLLNRSRLDFANLLAAARATLGADQDGESDPLAYLRDEVNQYQTGVRLDGGDVAR
jgi:hypothetical protein